MQKPGVRALFVRAQKHCPLPETQTHPVFNTTNSSHWSLAREDDVSGPRNGTRCPSVKNLATNRLGI